MEKQKVYASDERVNGVMAVFVDQKLKYNIEELPTSKIQGLSGINAYVINEVLEELKNRKIIEVSKLLGKRVYWRLV